MIAIILNDKLTQAQAVEVTNRLLQKLIWETCQIEKCDNRIYIKNSYLEYIKNVVIGAIAANHDPDSHCKLDFAFASEELINLEIDDVTELGLAIGVANKYYDVDGVVVDNEGSLQKLKPLPLPNQDYNRTSEQRINIGGHSKAVSEDALLFVAAISALRSCNFFSRVSNDHSVLRKNKEHIVNWISNNFESTVTTSPLKEADRKEDDTHSTLTTAYRTGSSPHYERVSIQELY